MASVKGYLAEKDISKERISEIFKGDYMKKWIPAKQRISKWLPRNLGSQQLRGSVCQSVAKNLPRLEIVANPHSVRLVR